MTENNKGDSPVPARDADGNVTPNAVQTLDTGKIEAGTEPEGDVVFKITDRDDPNGVVGQVGGDTKLATAGELRKAGYPVDADVPDDQVMSAYAADSTVPALDEDGNVHPLAVQRVQEAAKPTIDENLTGTQVAARGDAQEATQDDDTKAKTPAKAEAAAQASV